MAEMKSGRTFASNKTIDKSLDKVLTNTLNNYFFCAIERFILRSINKHDILCHEEQFICIEIDKALNNFKKENSAMNKKLFASTFAAIICHAAACAATTDDATQALQGLIQLCARLNCISEIAIQPQSRAYIDPTASIARAETDHGQACSTVADIEALRVLSTAIGLAKYMYLIQRDRETGPGLTLPLENSPLYDVLRTPADTIWYDRDLRHEFLGQPWPNQIIDVSLARSSPRTLANVLVLVRKAGSDTYEALRDNQIQFVTPKGTMDGMWQRLQLIWLPETQGTRTILRPALAGA
jgi:hypothetical protein